MKKSRISAENIRLEEISEKWLAGFEETIHGFNSDECRLATNNRK